MGPCRQRNRHEPLNLSTSTAITDVVDGEPAAEMGLDVGDTITAIGGRRTRRPKPDVRAAQQLRRRVARDLLGHLMGGDQGGVATVHLSRDCRVALAPMSQSAADGTDDHLTDHVSVSEDARLQGVWLRPLLVA
ncbi:PDZ domain-containing protein [Nocardioides caldifontis]|uniref:PDZ domain-containing protein n=1 Tax=Nocardioides caldifontis TaxID=2588938 RepID=UPI0011E04866|nr:PDZ domain-containing protein [Nocardioides caldifontis]